MTGPRPVSSRREEESDGQPLPTISEQIADQLGGVRGLIESGIPVAVFVIAKPLWALFPALLLSVGVALIVAIWRLSRREPIRPTMNGLVGVGIGFFLAWRSGQARDFHLGSIVYTFGY